MRPVHWWETDSPVFLFSSSIPFLSLPSSSNTQTQPSCHDNPIHAASFLVLQSTQTPLPAAAIWLPLLYQARWLLSSGESFQIKAFSQKTLKSRCRQALNKKTNFPPVSSRAFRWKLWGSITLCCSVCCEVSASKRGCLWLNYDYEFISLSANMFTL